MWQRKMKERNSTKERIYHEWTRSYCKKCSRFLDDCFLGKRAFTNSAQIGSRANRLGADSELEHPIPVPEAALKALRSALQATPDELPGDQLRASKIHLRGSTEADLVVPVVGGGHAVFFYILRPTSDGYQLIFDSGGDSMTVLRTMATETFGSRESRWRVRT